MQFEIQTSGREVVDITRQVEEKLSESDLAEGICTVFTPHATAAVTINENNDPNICDDLLKALDKLIPRGVWKHDQIDGNGAAHIKSAIVGPSESIPIKDGKLQLGTWQSIMLCDFDGPRRRRVIVETR